MPRKYTLHTLKCERCGAEFQAPKKRQRFCGYVCARNARPAPPSTEELYWRKVDTTPNADGCQLWTGGVDGSGYGQFAVKRVGVKAHRYAYELAYGPIPDGMMVLHKCPGGGTRRCVNPQHLKLGTHIENMQDMVQHGRQATGDDTGSRLYPERLAHGKKNGAWTRPERRRRGESSGMAKLTEQAVRDIRQRKTQGDTLVTIAADYGVSFSTIARIVRRQTWQHVA